MAVTSDWRLELSQDWDVLGPFPIHAREQHFLSPAFPLNLSEPIDFSKKWPSSYADGGKVSWNIVKSTNGNLNVSFPNVRWATLRATEGWAAMQHHAVLRTSVTLFPPISPSLIPVNPPYLRVRLLQGSYFTLLPHREKSSQDHSPLAPKWHAGDIYAMERVQSRAVQLPGPPSTISPTKYDVFISGDYEMRLFGDPHTRGTETPELKINFSVEVNNADTGIIHEPKKDIICDFVDGFAFGNAVGVGLRSNSGWWRVKEVALTDLMEGFAVTLVEEIDIAPTQTRIIPIRFSQNAPFKTHQLSLDIKVISHIRSAVVTVVLTIVNHRLWSASGFSPIKASYFYAQSMPTAFLVLPPLKPNSGKPQPPILTLHGAGVDIFNHSFWVNSLARQDHTWVVIPTGRTSWGLDWHGSSTKDVWESLDALTLILEENCFWHPWKLSKGTPVVVIGHSNGGQGAWYLASRYPDRVLGVVPAAGYIKSQSYIPWSLSRSAHFIDPALRSILDTALTPDDNDLFLSNLADTPVLAIHGGNDENVPVWHSREAVSVLQAWKLASNATLRFREDPSQTHWYPSVFRNNEVQQFLESVVTNVHLKLPSEHFTLTVSIPSESGSLHGWTVESMDIPGRLARIHVDINSELISVRTANVNVFSVDTSLNKFHTLVIDGYSVSLVDRGSNTQFLRLQKASPRIWQVSTNNYSTQASGRLQTILSTSAPFILVTPDDDLSPEFSVAQRIAHDLSTYHDLSAGHLTSSEALQHVKAGTLGKGNIVIIGDASTPFVRWVIGQGKTPFGVTGSSLTLNSHQLDHKGIGILFLHPHLTSTHSKMLFILSTDSYGLERAARLFPIRTGITVPDWLVVGESADSIGAAGVIGAGVWGQGWTWNEPLSWIYP